MTNLAPKLTPQQEFERSLQNKLAKDIGELIPDEVLAAMIHKSMEKLFFAKREDPQYKNSYHAKYLPSVFEETVEALMLKRIDIEVKRWFQQNTDKLEKAITESLREKGPAMVASAVVSLMLNIAKEKSTETTFDLEARLRNIGLEI